MELFAVSSYELSLPDNLPTDTGVNVTDVCSMSLWSWVLLAVSVVVLLLTVVGMEKIFRMHKIRKLRRALLYLSPLVIVPVSVIPAAATSGINTDGMWYVVAALNFTLMFVTAWRIGRIPPLRSAGVAAVYFSVLSLLYSLVHYYAGVSLC